MLSWWHRRKECQLQVIRDADKIVALFGEGAYSAAVARARNEVESGGDPNHWFAVRREIARRTSKDIGLVAFWV